MTNKTILHYEILEKLGRGGMGEVFLARDTRLDREVAIKFIRESELANEELRSRFDREAKAASRLTHANIVSIFSFEQAEGRDFIVMEYVRGRSLGDVIQKGNLTIDDALRITQEISDALQAAQAHGIVHRDIKAENVIISEEGPAKVLDFGLATVEGASRLTQPDSAVGTLAYMSPEQLEGKEVDHRTDIFALGVLFYEMVTGRLPFEGDHPSAVTYAILNEDPEPVARYKANLPDEVQRILDKALRKELDQRYQSAADLKADILALTVGAQSGSHPRITSSRAVAPAASISSKLPLAIGIAAAAVVVVAGALLFALRGGGSSSGGSDRVMIAVLPFQNLGATEDQYFADGVTEEITARLASIPELGVIARASVQHYNRDETSIDEIGKDLGVDYILDGSVRWQRGTDGTSDVRVTPQLIRVDDGTNVWAEVYDEPLDAVFEVQSDIAKRVTAALDIRLGGDSDAVVAAAPTDNVEAYQFYLQGVEQYHKAVTREDSDNAEQLLSMAIELDPNFMAAYARLAMVFSQRNWYWGPNTDYQEKSETYSTKAAELDPDAYETKIARGYYYYHGIRDYERALVEFREAIRVRPSAADAFAAVAFVERRRGKFSDSLEPTEKAIELSPKDPVLAFVAAETLLDMRRYEDCEHYLDRAAAIDPSYAAISLLRIWVPLLSSGDVDSAREALDRSSMPEDHPLRIYFNAYLHMLKRDYASAIGVLESTEGPDKDDYYGFMPAGGLTGQAYLLSGDAEAGRRDLETARRALETEMKTRPEDSRVHSSMGVVLALLGEKEASVASAEKACDILPVELDSKLGPHRRIDLAVVYGLAGEHDKAIDELEYLLELDGALIDKPLIRIDPIWDSLRNNPRFIQLVGK